MMKGPTLGTERISARIEGRIGWLTFDNPARRNAISLEMWQGVTGALEHFETAEEVRVVVMQGAGGEAFVSGADIGEFDQKRFNAEQKEEYAHVSRRGIGAMTVLTKPLLAEICGYCIGAGLNIALCADVRFATPDSKLGIPAARLGLGYDYENVARLARVVGPAHAREILLSARLLEAGEALRMGLVHFVVERDRIRTAVIDYAERVAANAPLTLRAAKAALNAWERGGRQEELAAVQRIIDACFDSDDYREGRRAFAAKEGPSFKGR